MKRIARFAVVGGLAVCMAGAVALAAGSEKAKVSNLVNAIAAKKGVTAAQVLSILETKSGRRLDLNATLDQGLAASILSDLGVPLQSSRPRDEMSVSDVNRAATLFTVARLSAEDNGDDGENPCADGRDNLEVCNRGRARPAQARIASPADPNAFGTLRDDPR